MEEQNTAHQKYYNKIKGHISIIQSSKKRAKLTRNILKKQEDWYMWEASEFKELQQYEDQGMFSKPVEISSDANFLPFMWKYVLIDYGGKQ